MDYVFVWVFLAIIAVIVVVMIYDNFKCKHEWEHHTYKITNKRTQEESTTMCLICKKCGKVKVLK